MYIRCFLSSKEQTEENYLCCHWPYKNTISTLLVNNPTEPWLLLVKLLTMAKDDSSTASAQKMLMNRPHLSIRRPNGSISVLSYCQELAHQSLCKMQISQ